MKTIKKVKQWIMLIGSKLSQKYNLFNACIAKHIYNAFID